MWKSFENIGLQTSEKVSWEKNKQTCAKHKIDRSQNGRSNEESIEVLGLQSGVGGDQRRPRLAHKAQRGTAVPSRAGTYTPSRTV